MRDIRGGSYTPHILGTFNRVVPPTIGVNLARFGDKWSNSKTQISKSDFGQICGGLEGGLMSDIRGGPMSDIRGGSNLPHILGNAPRRPPPTRGVNLARFGDKWSNSKTQISISDFDQICGRLDPSNV